MNDKYYLDEAIKEAKKAFALGSGLAG